MTPDDVRAAAEQLVDFHEHFAPLFGKDQAQDHAYDYLKGLMVCPERKSIEPIALLVGLTLQRHVEAITRRVKFARHASARSAPSRRLRQRWRREMPSS